MRRRALTAVLAIVAIGLPVASASGAAASARPAHRGEAADGRIIVSYRPGTSATTKSHARDHAAAAFVEKVNTRTEVVRAPKGKDADQVMQDLESQPGVAYAEPDERLTAATSYTSNDPAFLNGQLWGLGGGFGSNASTAWASGNVGSSDVYVGIIDTGVQYSHPDLASNVWTNPFDPPDGVDNDGNGYVDDAHGWDFYSGNNSVYDSSTYDDHGTHVAGTIGGVGGNGTGVAGENWHVTMIPAKFLGPNGGYTSDAVRAVQYLTDLKVRHKINLVAINNSWGGGGYSQSLQDAISAAAKQNILFIAAAGNNSSNNDTTAEYPGNYNTTSAAGYDSVISVAAIDANGNLASWSDYGSTTVDLGAPGVSVYSTLPPNTYGTYSGTSMATPHVTGAAALYAAGHPGATALQIRNAILGSVTPTASLSGKTVSGGRLNVGAFGPAAPAAVGTITGTVTRTSDGTGIDGATVSVSNTLTATTSGGGHYSIANVPVGTYSVSVAAAGFVAPGSQSVDVTDGGTTTADFQLDAVPPPTNSTVAGTVTWAGDGTTTIDGAQVTLSGTGQTATTAGGGAYSIADVAPGTYTVTVSATDHATATASITVGSSGGTVTANVSLNRLVTITAFTTLRQTDTRYWTATVTLGNAAPGAKLTGRWSYTSTRYTCTVTTGASSCSLTSKWVRYSTMKWTATAVTLPTGYAWTGPLPVFNFTKPTA